MNEFETLEQYQNSIKEFNERTRLEFEDFIQKQGSGWASIFDHNQGELKECEIEFREKWCKQQIELIGEFGAVLGGGV